MKTILTLFIFLFTHELFAQNFGWAKHFPTQGHNSGVDITTDAAGNVYSVGTMEDSIDLDPGPGAVMFGLNSQGAYISKLNANGDFVWAKSFGGPGGNINIKGIRLDNAGNIFICGDFQFTVDFDPGPGVYNVTMAGTYPTRNSFLCKLDNNGNFIWVKSYGDQPGGSVTPINMEIDAAGNIYTTGLLEGSGDFDPGPGVYNLTAVGYSDIFILKVDHDGNLLWARIFTNNIEGGGGGYGLALDAAGNVYTTGYYTGTADFDPGPGFYYMSTASPASLTYSAFISKLDPNGNFVWAKQVTGPLEVFGYSIKIDAASNVYISGNFNGSSDFDPGPSVNTMTASGQSEVFLLKLDVNGNFLWSKHFGGQFNQLTTHLCIDPFGNLYLSGTFEGTVDMDPGPAVLNFTSAGWVDAFISKLNSNGDLLWIQQIGGASYYDIVFSSCSDGLGNVYFTGYFGQTVDFDPGPAVYNLTTPVDSQDPFVLKLTGCSNISSSTLNVNTCNAYTLNGQVYTADGVYTQVLANSSGCDSIITLNLVIGGSSTDLYDTACGSYAWEGQVHASSGNYSVTHTGSNGCDSVRTLHLIIKPIATTTENINICEGQSYHGHTTTAVYTNTYTAANGCDSIYNLDLQVNPLPANFLKQVDSICSDDKLLIKSQHIYTNYLWSTGSNQSDITVNSSGQYLLTVTDANGCIGVDSILIVQKNCACTATIPNAITPNGDGINDRWVITYPGCIKKINAHVFSSHGKIVYEKSNYQNDWEGTYHSEPLPDGTYYYVVEATDDHDVKQVFKGNITILR